MAVKVKMFKGFGFLSLLTFKEQAKLKAVSIFCALRAKNSLLQSSFHSPSLLCCSDIKLFTIIYNNQKTIEFSFV